MSYYPFDSRNSLYKSIQTAAPSGQPLRLRLLLHRDAEVISACLKYRNDNSDMVYEVPMTAGDWLEDYRFFEAEVSFPEGLFWYSFEYSSPHGYFYIVKTEHSLGIVSADPGAWWQQTVYSADFKIPDSFAGGIIYQIFPDRFNKSGNIQNPYPDRYICEDWSAMPAFNQDNNPRRLCNDYYGGNLRGIIEKLSYIKSLGVSCIYLNPIFEAHSNHRYNTADYMKIDPLLGTQQDFTELCEKAKALGISVILDGVFSHTGDDSIYFNKSGRYSSLGAYNDEKSEYKSWFNFYDWPDGYHSWWGVPSLPETNELDPDFVEFITGENGVLRHWLRLGASGWRLDVADELPDEFLDAVRCAVKAEKPDALLIGEVWEDATNKISHGGRRRFLRGKQLDSVMNYPLANLIIGFVCGGNARELIDGILTLKENYPPACLNLLMNHIGTHDTPRILTRLGDGGRNPGDRQKQSEYKLPTLNRFVAQKRLVLASVLQYTLPGIPSLYYGDEAGCEGYSDPFCRGTYPWGTENKDLVSHYKFLGRVRSEHPAFSSGEFIPLYSDIGYVTYLRSCESEDVFICVNRWCDNAEITLPCGFENAEVIAGNKPNGEKLIVNSESYAILCRKK